MRQLPLLDQTHSLSDSCWISTSYKVWEPISPELWSGLPPDHSICLCLLIDVYQSAFSLFPRGNFLAGRKNIPTLFLPVTWPSRPVVQVRPCIGNKQVQTRPQIFGTETLNIWKGDLKYLERRPKIFGTETSNIWNRNLEYLERRPQIFGTETYIKYLEGGPKIFGTDTLNIWNGDLKHVTSGVWTNWNSRREFHSELKSHLLQFTIFRERNARTRKALISERLAEKSEGRGICLMIDFSMKLSRLLPGGRAPAQAPLWREALPKRLAEVLQSVWGLRQELFHWQLHYRGLWGG